MGPKGVEPSPNDDQRSVGARSPSCWQLHHSPMIGRAYAFQSSQHFKLLPSNFKSGSPEDRTQRDPRIRRIWATSPRLPCCVFKKVGHLGVEPPVAEQPTNERSLLVPNQACFHLHLYPMLFVVFAADDSVGAYLPCQWAGRRSNPRLRFFRPPLDRLSYQPILGSFLGLPVRCGHEKRLGVCDDTEPS
jgi:hypothetical protein